MSSRDRNEMPDREADYFKRRLAYFTTTKTQIQNSVSPEKPKAIPCLSLSLHDRQQWTELMLELSFTYGAMNWVTGWSQACSYPAFKRNTFKRNTF